MISRATSSLHITIDGINEILKMATCVFINGNVFQFTKREEEEDDEEA